MTTKAVQKITFQEYLSYDDGTENRYEFIDGELVLMPPPSPLHEDIVHFLLVFSDHLVSHIFTEICLTASQILEAKS